MAAMVDNVSLSNEEESVRIKKEDERRFKIKAGLFLTGVTAISALIGFSTTVAAVKKKEPEFFKQGFVGAGIKETGASLAMRALGWGTVYAVSGCSILFYAIWKLSGANNLEEFRIKMGQLLPKIPKKDNAGRSEFEDVHDFLSYIDATSKESKRS